MRVDRVKADVEYMVCSFCWCTHVIEERDRFVDARNLKNGAGTTDALVVEFREFMAGENRHHESAIA